MNWCKHTLFRLSALCLILSNWSCYYGYAPQRVRYYDEPRPVTSRPYAPQRLTLDLIDQFNISPLSLQNLNYYLENGLVLYQSASHGVSAVTPSGELVLRRQTRQNEIVFQHLARGRIVSLQEEFQFSSFRSVYKISVYFAESSPYYRVSPKYYALTFAPNLHGEYVLEKSFWGNTVTFGGYEYTVSEAQTENFLLVEVNLQDDYTPTRRMMPSGQRY